MSAVTKKIRENNPEIFLLWKNWEICVELLGKGQGI